MGPERERILGRRIPVVIGPTLSRRGSASRSWAVSPIPGPWGGRRQFVFVPAAAPVCRGVACSIVRMAARRHRCMARTSRGRSLARSPAACSARLRTTGLQACPVSRSPGPDHTSPQGLRPDPKASQRQLLGGAKGGSIPLSALLSCQRHTRGGIRIPNELVLAGYGDPDWFEIWGPGITSFAPPLAEMGAQAAKVLLDLISGNEPPATMSLITGVLRIRGTLAKGNGPSRADCTQR